MTDRRAALYRVDITRRNSGGSTSTISYATEDYIKSDGTWVDGRCIQPGLFARWMFAPNAPIGAPQIPTGGIVLENSDGALDGLDAYSYDGLIVNCYSVDRDTLADTLVYRAVAEQPVFTEKQVTMLVRDLLYAYTQQPFSANKYGGTNTLPAGMDGTASDIKGKPYARCSGSVLNVTPTCVNTDRQIYHLTGPFAYNTSPAYVITLYDKRSPMGAGVARTLTEFQNGKTDYTVSSIDTATDQITLTASFASSTGEPVHVTATTTVPGGLADSQYYYARALGGAVISLHPTAADATGNTNKVNITSAGTGTVTVSVNSTPYGSADTMVSANGAWARYGSQPALPTFDAEFPVYAHTFSTTGLTISDVAVDVLLYGSSADATGLAADPEVGFSANGEELTVQEALERLLQSVGATIFYSRADNYGALRLVQLASPTGTAVLEIDDTNIIGEMRPQRAADDPRGIPVWRVNLNYAPNNTPNLTATDLAGVDLAERERWTKPFLTVTSEDSSVKAQWPRARELNVTTYLINESDAQDEADRLLDLFKVRRQIITVTMHDLDVNDASDLELGGVVNVTYPRFGLDAGKKFRVLGIVPDFASGTVDLTLWG